MRTLFTLTLLFISFSIFAATGGPDNYGYTWKDSDEPDGPDYNWIDITQYFNATEVKLLGDDNSRGPFAMNFDFHFYWYEVNQFWVGSNGYIMFEDGQIASPFPLLPNVLLPNNVLGACMNDLTFLGSNNPAECWYWISSGLDTLIVSWINVPFFDTNGNGYSGSNTFQIILSAVDNSITYQYKAVDPFSPYSGSSSVGMENYSGLDGLHWPNGNSFQTPNDLFAIKFYFPDPPSQIVVTDAAMVYNDNPGTGAIFIPTNGDPFDLTALVRNYSTHTVDPFNVQCKVFSPTGQLIIDNGAYVDTLLSTQSQLLTFPTTLSASTAGSYRFITNTQLSGDQATANNDMQMEIVAVDTTETDIWLGYDNGVTSNYTSINWIGGQGGIGSYFIPPFYPCAITKLHYFLSSSGAFAGRVFDDDGVSGLPYTLLDSVYMGSPLSGVWNTITLTDPVIIEDGGFYVSWDMKSTSVSLACLLTLPLSNRCFEIFDNIWGIFRFRETEDPMIAVSIEKYSIPTGIQQDQDASSSLHVFPNPASDVVSLLYTLDERNESSSIRITDLQGRMVKQYDLGTKAGTHQVSFDVSALPVGCYFATLISGDARTTQKLVVGK